MSSVAGSYTNCVSPIGQYNIHGNFTGNYSHPVGCLHFDHFRYCSDPSQSIVYQVFPRIGLMNDTNARLVSAYRLNNDTCETRFNFLFFTAPQYVDCIKDDCPTSTTQQPTTISTTHIPTTFTTTETSPSPTSFTIDTMATSVTSSASKDIGLLGSVVSKVKDTLSWINRLGTGSIPSQEVTTRDFTYDMQSKDVRSRVSRSEWADCVEVATSHYNSGKGYITPLDICALSR